MHKEKIQTVSCNRQLPVIISSKTLRQIAFEAFEILTSRIEDDDWNVRKAAVCGISEIIKTLPKMHQKHSKWCHQGLKTKKTDVCRTNIKVVSEIVKTLPQKASERSLRNGIIKVKGW